MYRVTRNSSIARCDHCGQPLPLTNIRVEAGFTELVKNGRGYTVESMTGKVIAALLRRAPGSVSRKALYESLYADTDPDRWPQEKLLDLIICRARKALKDTDLTIVTHWGYGWSIQKKVDNEGKEDYKGPSFIDQLGV